MPERMPPDGAALPPHPDATDETDPTHTPNKRPRWDGVIMAALFGALLVMIVLHVTGVVGPGAH